MTTTTRILSWTRSACPGASIRHLFTEGRAARHAAVVGAIFHGLRRAHGGDVCGRRLCCGSTAFRRPIPPLSIAFNGLGGFIGQSTAGRLIERFGIWPVLFPAFLLGTAATVGLGYGASSVALAATFIGLIGLFMGLGTGGAIALSALIYPTSIRSTGVGWGMAMGRFGQIVGPLIAGVVAGRRLDCGSNHDRHRLRRTDRARFSSFSSDRGVAGRRSLSADEDAGRLLSLESQYRLARFSSPVVYAVSTVRPTTRPARRSSSAACASRERAIAGRDRRDIFRARQIEKLARLGERAGQACPRSSSP